MGVLKRKGEKDMLNIMRYDSPVGALLLAEKNGALAGLWIEGQKYYMGSLREEVIRWGKDHPMQGFFPKEDGPREQEACGRQEGIPSREAFRYEEEKEEPDTGILPRTKEWLDRYFAGKRPAISELALAPAGSEFRRAVWKILCEIPYGEVTTYGEIARKIAKQLGMESMSAQAVGGAVGHNPISIIIPCHRVVGSDGSLTGYAGGLEKKLWLLTLEGAVFRSTST